MSTENDFEFIDTEDVSMNNMQIYQQDKALIDMQIATAKRYPRNLKRAIDNAITLVTRSLPVAESCTYSLKKGKTITGPSVHLARILAQRMGNMRTESRIVGFDDKHVTAEAVCFDLETNYAIRVQLKKSIVGNSGLYSSDLQVITGNAAAAVALRNAIFNVIGFETVNEVYSAAMQKITGDISDENKLITKRTSLFEGFKKNYSSYNLTDEEIAASLGKSSITNINAEDVLVLIGFEKSLKEGECNINDIFRSSNMKKKEKPADKSEDRIIKLINSAKDIKSLEALLSNCTSPASAEAYNKKFKSLK